MDVKTITLDWLYPKYIIWAGSFPNQMGYVPKSEISFDSTIDKEGELGNSDR